MRLRFAVADEGRASLLEAAIDAIKLRAVILPAPPPPAPPALTRLLTPWPQPFRNSVMIRYDLARPADVDLAVFDVRGRRVADVWHGSHSASPDSISWDGRGTDGRPLRTGVYFLRMDAGGTVSSRRIVRVK
jgi:endoglucanase